MNILLDIVDEYINTQHTTIGMKPNDAENGENTFGNTFKLILTLVI